MVTFLFAVALMAGTGLVLGIVIGIFAKLFYVASDPRVELMIELLPGANCGGCGMAGCADFAKALTEGRVVPSRCPVCSSEQVTMIAQALGIETGEAFKQSAVVLCGGDYGQVTRQESYIGVADCVSASLVAGGPKGCTHGCLGFGSCARKCPFGAIEMVNGLAVVHRELCVGCGMCIASCPRNIIKLVPASAGVHIYCSSPEKAPVKRDVCRVSCIGCRKCVKVSPEKFLVEGFRVAVNYEHSPLPTAKDVAAAACPTGALLSMQEHLELEEGKIEHGAPENE